MNPKIQCDECGTLYDNVNLRRKVLKDLVYEYYWMCGTCDFKHVSYYTNKRIRRDIKRQEKRWERYRIASTEDEERKRLAHIKTQDKLIKKDMDLLYEKMRKGVV